MALVKTLDFALFTKGSQQQREELGAALADGFLTAGFVKLVNHGIPEDVVDKVFDIVWTPQLRIHLFPVPTTNPRVLVQTLLRAAYRDKGQDRTCTQS